MTIFHGLSSASIRQRQLKELYTLWRGVLGAYDEGLIKGDAVLGTAIWRNLFNGIEDVDWTKVALVVSFMRRGMRALDKADDEVLLNARVRFGDPKAEMSLVEIESEGVQRPFTKEDAEAFTQFMQETAK